MNADVNIDVVQVSHGHFILHYAGEAYELRVKDFKELLEKIGELVMLDFKVWW